jgi:uncharacterized membrane protein YdjX (TVP38/TMEM64 family)
MRLFWFALALALLILIPFAIWGGSFEQWLTPEGVAAMIRDWGFWGGMLTVVVLLISDLFLPIPATPVMSAAGYVYGWFWGGVMSATGSFLAGATAYGLCRLLGRKIAERVVGIDDLAKGQRLFARRGPWLVAFSRTLPLLPEVIACLAGLVRMPVLPFMLSLACGSLPLGFIYSAIGATGIQMPMVAFLLSAAVPLVLWIVARRLLREPPVTQERDAVLGPLLAWSFRRAFSRRGQGK